MKTKKKVPSRILRKRLVAENDKLLSMYVRIRDKRRTGGRCVFGCGRMIQCCFHFITRSKYSTRFSPGNCVGSCSSCNYENEFNPHKFVKWLIERDGIDAYNSLVERSNRIAKFSNDDLEQIRDNLKMLLEGVCEKTLYMDGGM